MAIKKIFAFTVLVILTVAAPAMAGHSGRLSDLSFCGEKIPLNRQEVYQSIDQQLVLLAEAKSRIWLTLRRSDRFLPVVEKELKRAGVPDDLKFIPMSITSLAPDYNNVGKGMWRLREAEARALGLRVDKEVDERLDPVASTVAAAKRLTELKNAYGYWTTAMAAHLLSEPVVQKAINEAGGESEFYRIYLPNGLDAMPSMVLAGKVIFKSPGSFGYHQSPNRAWPVMSTRRETVKAPSTARELAAKYGKDYKTFRDMNPHLLSGSVPAGVTINIP